MDWATTECHVIWIARYAGQTGYSFAVKDAIPPTMDSIALLASITAVT